MAAGVTLKPKRKAGAFTGGQLAAGEVGLDTTNGIWYYSADGSTVVALGETAAPATAAVYVAKTGNDSDSGLTPARPKLTFASAITAASALITAGATGVTIHGLDGETYAIGTITVPSNVAIDAPGAIFQGGMVVNVNSSVRIRGHYPLEAQNSGVGVMFSIGSSGPAHYETDFLDQRSTATIGIEIPAYGTGVLFAKINTAHYVGTGAGVSATDGGAFSGHLHYQASDLYLAGNGAIGIDATCAGGAAVSIIGSIDHIIELGTPTGTTAIKVDDGSLVNLVVGEIIADTAYNIIDGSLYLTCGKITGTQTGTPSFLPAGFPVDLANGSHVTGVLPIANMATGTPDGTKFVRDDGTLATPAGGSGGGGRVLIDSATASGSASLTFDDVFDSTYDFYEIELIDFLPATDNARLEFVWRDAASEITGTYRSGATYLAGYDSGFYFLAETITDTGFSLIPSAGSGYQDSGSGGHGSWLIQTQPAFLGNTKYIFWDGHWLRGDTYSTLSMRGQGMIARSASVDGFRVRYHNGNISVGTARVWGVPKT